MQFLLGVVAAVVALFVPWTRGRSYEVSCVGKADCGRINGLLDTYRAIERAPGAPTVATVNLVLVHGMGAGPGMDYTPLTDDLAAYLGMLRVASADQVIPNNPPGTAPAVLFTRTYRTPDARRELSVFELHWWPLMQNSKARLLADERYYPGKRARINRGLKASLVNDRVADPIIYLGPLGDAIRYSAKFTLCKVAGGAYLQDVCTASGEPAPTVVVTESLGSEVVYASLREMSEAGDESAVARSTPSVFMLANQLPLLRLARKQSFEQRYQMTFGEAWPEVSGAPRQIVAVSDPSDLLSYPIPDSITETGTTFFNVTRPLGHRLAFGMVVEPLGAHTGAKKDGRVIKLIACGYPSSCATDEPPRRRRAKRAA
jgi:hypothetical protein